MRNYRLIDLTAFALLLCLLEAASAWAVGFFPGEAYTFSPVLFISLMVMARWGAIGIAYAALGGAVYCFLHGGTPVNYAVYIAGNLAVAVNLFWIRFLGVKRLRESAAYTVLYGITGYFAICLGRSAISEMIGQGFWFLRFIAVEALGAVITIIILLIARKQNGLLEPQVEYLQRMKEEEERKRGTKTYP